MSLSASNSTFWDTLPSTASTSTIDSDSDPERIVSVLGFRKTTNGVTNKWNDTILHLRPALKAAHKAAEKPSMRPWQALVKAGVAEQLCLGILEYDRSTIKPDSRDSVPFSPTHPSGYDEHLDGNAPWSLPLLILFDALTLDEASGLPTGETVQVIKELRKYWTRIMEKVWDETENVTHSVRELATLAGLIARVADFDPSVILAMDIPTDLTLSILARGWRHAHGPEWIVYVAALSRYFRALNFMPCYGEFEGRPRDAPSILGRLLKGLKGFPFESMHQLMLRLSKGVFFQSDGRYINHSIAYLLDMVVYHDPEKLKKTTEYKSLYRATHLSPSLWELQFKQVRERNIVGEVPPEEDMMLGTIRGYRNVLSTAGSERDQKHLVLAWINGGLLETQEWLVTTATRNGVDRPRWIATIAEMGTTFKFINQALNDNRTATLEALYPNLPRPRLLRSLLDLDLSTRENMSSSPGKSITFPLCGGERVNVDHNLHSSWISLFLLQNQRFSRAECGKRGCPANGVSQCSVCKTVKYCTAKCQKDDWSEHKLVCGLRVWMNDRELGTPADLSRMEREGWPFTEYRCGSVRFVVPGKRKR